MPETEKKEIDEDYHVFLEYSRILSAGLASIEMSQLKKVTDVLRECKRKDRNVYIMGNGGSASTAEHWVNDFMKIGGMRARSLCTLPVISAFGNDIGYEDIFVEQLKVLLREGDVVVGITGSGNSPNILKGLEYAIDHKAVPVAILGFSGGKVLDLMKDKAYVHVKANDYGVVEDLHLSIDHYLARVLKSS